MFLKNAKFGRGEENEVKNGTMARILNIDDHILSVELQSGKRMDINTKEYRSIAHAYAITTHKSQGITVDHAAIMGGGFMQSLNQTYVQLSRVRHDVDFILPKSEIEKAMSIVEPTNKMLELALKTATKQGHDTADIEAMTFLECRDYLNEHTSKIEGKQETEKNRWQREIGDLIKRMATVENKETTLDYVVEEKEPIKQHEQEIDVVM